MNADLLEPAKDVFYLRGTSREPSDMSAYARPPPRLPNGVSHISHCLCGFSHLRSMCPPHHLPLSLWQLQLMLRRAPGVEWTVVAC